VVLPLPQLVERAFDIHGLSSACKQVRQATSYENRNKQDPCWYGVGVQHWQWPGGKPLLYESSNTMAAKLYGTHELKLLAPTGINQQACSPVGPTKSRCLLCVTSSCISSPHRTVSTVGTMISLNDRDSGMLCTLLLSIQGCQLQEALSNL
jgi:hypothetical protein